MSRERPTRERPTRERILWAAIQLFQERGYHGVGLTEILAAAAAPKGSLYHHFPDGKAELAVVAIEAVASDYAQLVAARRERGVGVAAIVRGLAKAQAEWLKAKEWREAGLFSVLAQGFLPDAPAVHEALARVYRQRHIQLTRALEEDGARDPGELATLALAALDGGMIQAAATRSGSPLLEAAEQAACVIEAACRPATRQTRR